MRAGAPGHATVNRYLFDKNRTKEQSPIVLHPAGSYEGRVLTPEGRPQAGAWVTLTSKPGTRYPSHHGKGFRTEDDTLLLALAGARWTATRSVHSNDNGRFVFDDVPLRLHDLFVQAGGYQPLRERDVVPDGPTLELRLRPAIQLAVEVRDQLGRPVQQAQVEAWRGAALHPNILVVDSPSDPTGAFVVHNASETVTTVRAFAPLLGEVFEKVLDGQTSLRLVLPSGGAVEVLVMKEGQPVPGQEINCTRKDKLSGGLRVYGSVKTDKNGRARFEHIEPGTLTFELLGWFGRLSHTGGPLDVEVRDGETVSLSPAVGPTTKASAPVLFLEAAIRSGSVEWSWLPSSWPRERSATSSWPCPSARGDRARRDGIAGHRTPFKFPLRASRRWRGGSCHQVGRSLPPSRRGGHSIRGPSWHSRASGRAGHGSIRVARTRHLVGGGEHRLGLDWFRR